MFDNTAPVQSHGCRIKGILLYMKNINYLLTKGEINVCWVWKLKSNIALISMGSSLLWATSVPAVMW